MTDEELAAIKATLAQATVYPSHTSEERLYLDAPIAFAQNVIRLSAEVERLLDERAALLEVVRAVADETPVGPMIPSGSEWECGFCGGTGPWNAIRHLTLSVGSPNEPGTPYPCPVIQARALLAD